ncbi:MAG: hypothetical protein EHM18_01805 [Acidobacteria bacterium]|nr:MAG: hypothetical protein EHM18_01805 [Acidobacteriota bacterium]
MRTRFRIATSFGVIFLTLLTAACGCALPPLDESFSDLWVDLSLYDDGYEPARDNLIERLSRFENRQRALEFIEKSVKCSSIHHEDQLRLATLLAVVRNQATSESEHARIFQAILRTLNEESILPLTPASS